MLLVCYTGVLLLAVTVVALAARVNIWQEYFFMADLLPLGLSISTLVLVMLLLLVSITPRAASSFLARPRTHISVLGLLSILWLISNAFSSSRWGGIPFPCSDIPEEYNDVRGWCQDAQALKFFVWILFLSILFTTASIARYVRKQASHGNRHIWGSALSRFDPRASMDFGHNRAPSLFNTPIAATNYRATDSGGNGAFMPGVKW